MDFLLHFHIKNSISHKNILILDIYTHVHIYTYTNTGTYIHTCTYVHIYKHWHIYTDLYTFIPMNVKF